MSKNIKSRTKKLWYGWRSQAAKHFGVGERTIDDWFWYKGTGTKRAIQRIKLRDWCSDMLRQSGLNDEEVDSRIKEAFGE